MFGMVLAIGILVDDAIVVVENVERIMANEGLSPRDATRKAMARSAVPSSASPWCWWRLFIPMAFMQGSVGVIYQQFSLSMATSILFSAFLALTLTPALCATLLKRLPRASITPRAVSSARSTGVSSSLVISMKVGWSMR